MKHVKFIINGRYGKVSIIKRIDELTIGEFPENVFRITVFINGVAYKITGLRGSDYIELKSVCCFELNDNGDFVSEAPTPIEAIYME